MKSRDPSLAPKDGTILRLLVQMDENPLEDDNSEPIWTIGHNNFLNDGEDNWQFAGWDWSHDCYTQATGTVVGWEFMTSEEVQPPKTMDLDDDFEKGVVYSVQIALNFGQETLAREILGSCGITPQSDLTFCAEYDLNVLRSHLPEFVNIPRGVE